MAAGGSARAYLSVVVPAYNEARRLGPTLDRIAGYIDGGGLDAEILVVDDGSRDETAALAERRLRGRAGRVIRTPENRGKGHAVRTGVLAATGRWVLLTDADLSTPVEEHRRLADVVRDRDLDVAIGSRGLAESRVEVRQSALRQFLGRSFNRIIRALTGLPYRDTQCGFKLLDRERTRPLFERMVVDRFAFDVELLVLCHRYGLAVAEIPVVWRNSPHSTVSLVRDPLNMFADVLRVLWRFRRGLYRPEAPGPGA